MAKFAKSKPDIGTAKADRNVIERVITETKEAIPEPTEEELLADEEYRKTDCREKEEEEDHSGEFGRSWGCCYYTYCFYPNQRI